jgi:hypothetical protein
MEGRLWQFFKIQRNSTVHCSACIDFWERPDEVCTWLNYIITNALKNTPTCNPASSSFDLTETEDDILVQIANLFI